jgi:hypothetical protein
MTICNNSSAFDGDEHYLLSNTAFLLSLSYTREYSTFISDGNDQYKKIPDLLELNFTQNDYLNFGTISKSVDYMFDPSRYLSFICRRSSKMSDKEPDQFDVLTSIGSDSKQALVAKDFNIIEKMLSSKYNIEHFEEKSLAKFYQFHNLAKIQALKKNLGNAMVLDAIASHYLEDFFASGHIKTPRSNVNNIRAIAYHGYYNLEGINVNIRNYMSKTTPGTGNDSKTTCKNDKLAQLIKSGDFSKLLESKNDRYSQQQFEGGIENIKSDTPLKFYGDSQLDVTKGQKEIIIIEVAKSIIETFETFNKGVLVGDDTYKSDYLKVGEINNELISIKFDNIEFEKIDRSNDSIYEIPLIFEASPYLLSPFAQNTSARWGCELDVGVYRKMPVFDWLYVGGAIGYDYNRDTNNRYNYSKGPMGKLMFEIKDLDIGLDLYLKLKKNKENENRFNSKPWGARLNFSRDIVVFFIGLGDEPRYKEYNHVLTLNTGVTIHDAIIPKILKYKLLNLISD